MNRFGRDTQAVLQRIAELGPNWDSYGALPPSPQAIAQAGFLIEAVAEGVRRRTGRSVGPWTVAPLADGGVHIEWRGPGKAIEVDVDAAGPRGYLIEVALPRPEGSPPPQPHRYEETNNTPADRVRTKIATLLSFGL